MSLEEWLTGVAVPERVAILRHDVDQHPASVLPMLAIEQELGVRATWYFRWRTSDRRIVERVRAAGGQVGLHYETLTRLVRERGIPAEAIDERVVAEAQGLLRREIEAFQRAFGAIRSVCPHGDTRVPGVSNQILLREQRPEGYGIEFDGNDAIDRRPLSLWLTDRSVSEGRWKDGIDPGAELSAGVSPILLVIHPNNWCSGASLWRDRIRAAVLPTPSPASRRRRWLGPRTGSDAPPLGAPPPGAAGTIRDFDDIAVSLRREILRFNYASARSLADPAGLNTLATNSELAPRRAEALEHALGRAGIGDLRGRRVLDVGCGFGALALVFAARGASVLAVDPNAQRMGVGRAVAAVHRLPVEFRRASMEELEVGDGRFDVAVMNNSLCYLVDRQQRHEALRHALRALRPGGVLVVRNPNRLHPVDQFTGLPLLAALPPRAARGMTRLLRRHRSEVRMLTPGAARRELRRAGFTDVRSVRRIGESRPRALLAGYQHLTGRRPGP